MPSDASVSDQQVDLRSDTFTLPTPSMYRAMTSAPLGDDVWGEDPTVKQLEYTASDLTGKEAALLLPSATMANLIAVLAQTNPGDEVVMDRYSHIFLYESGGGAAIGGVQYLPLDFADGCPSPTEVTGAIRPADVHQPTSRLLCLENTHNYRGGLAIPVAEMAAAAAAARAEGLRVHLDGARIFNAALALGTSPAELAGPADTVSLSLTKGLSAPVGGLLAGDGDIIAAARRWRKRLGGGMRQAGILAAAGMVALTEMPPRLVEDHANAARLALGISRIDGLELAAPVRTNIVVVRVTGDPAEVVARCRQQGVQLSQFGPGRIRMVTHRGITSADVDHTLAVLAAQA